MSIKKVDSDSYEKIIDAMDFIWEKSVLNRDNTIHSIGKFIDSFKKFSSYDLYEILGKLEKVKVIKIFRCECMHPDHDHDKYRDWFAMKVKVDKFKAYYKKIEDSRASRVLYKIQYKKSRDIVVNNTYYLSRPDFMSENDIFFDFIYRNPRKNVTVSKLKNEIGGLKKNIRAILSDLKFTKEIKKCFFPGVSDYRGVIFLNEVTKKDIIDGDVNKELLDKQLEKYRKK